MRSKEAVSKQLSKTNAEPIVCYIIGRRNLRMGVSLLQKRLPSTTFKGNFPNFCDRIIRHDSSFRIQVHLSDYPFFDSEPLHFRKWKRESMLISDEFTILFLGHLYIFMRDNPKEFSSILSKDKEIYTFYEKYISILLLDQFRL